MKRLRLNYYQWANGSHCIKFTTPDDPFLLPKSAAVQAESVIILVPDAFTPELNTLFTHGEEARLTRAMKGAENALETS